MFDTCIVSSIHLGEIPFLISAFGLDGVLELLSAGALEIYHSFFRIVGGVTRGGVRTTPNYCFDFGTMDIASPEKHIHECLACFHDIHGLSHKQILKLKREVTSRLVKLEAGVGENILEQMKHDIRTNSPIIRSAIRLRLQEIHPGVEIPDFALRFEEVPQVGFRANTDLAARLNISAEDCHKLLENSLFAIGNLDHRLGEMRAMSALTGFSREESQLFIDKCDFLLKELNPARTEQAFERVLQIADFPRLTIDGKNVTARIGKLLEIRQTDEAREFRQWLGTICDASDAEIKDRISSLRSRLGGFVDSTGGKVLRLIVSSGVGAIPGVGLALGPTAGFVDSFLLQRIFPKSGVVSFLSRLYPSIFERSGT